MRGFLVNTINAASSWAGSSHSLSNDNHWLFNRELGYPLGRGKKKYGEFGWNKEQAFRLAPVFACQRNIAESLAVLPRQFIQTPSKDEREVVTDHPSLKIFTGRANSIMTSNTVFKTITNHAIGWGNGYAEIQRARGGARPLALWPIPPARVKPECFISASGEPDIKYRILLPDGRHTYLPKESMLHILGISFNGYEGISVLEAACRAIGLGDALEEFAIKFYEQGMVGGGFVQVPFGMEPQAIKNLKDELEEMNESGLDGAHRLKFLYDSVTFAENFIKPEEGQFILTKEDLSKQIAMFYRHPLHKLGIWTDQSYNSSEQSNHDWVTDTLQPWGKTWEEEVDSKFFIESRDQNINMRFNYTALLRGDSKARAEYYRTMIMSGVMTQNEARRFEDLPKMEGGDELLVPLNMTNGKEDKLSEKQDDARERIQD